jgi:fatty-acyl-CoA synthase
MDAGNGSATAAAGRPAEPEDLAAARRGTIWQALQRNARRYPDKVAYVQVDDDRQRHALSYGEVAERATRLSEGLFATGVRRGDRLAVWMTNRPQWIITYFAAMRLGAVLVPLNTWLTAPEIGYQLRQSEARHLVIQDRFRKIDFVGALARLAPEVGTAPRGALYSPALPDLRNVIVCQRTGARGHGNLHQWSELARGAPAERAPDLASDWAAAAAAASAGVTGADLAMIKYTSGSTGRPKGVMLDQGGIVVFGKAHTERLGLTPDDVFFSAMPFFHAGGSLWGMQTMLELGGRLVFTEAFDPPLAGQLIESERCTVLFGILANELVTSALEAGRDFSSVRMSRPGGHGAGQLMPNSTLVINPFGLTECYGAVTLCGPEDPAGKQRSTSGRPLRGQQVKAVDPETGAEAAPGVVGEAWVRGNTMRGYWKNPEATAAMIDDDGWVHSEDLVSVDSDGYVTYASRLKLMLKVGGENVSVEEVERTISEHEAVFHCVVVGVPDQRKTETGRAYVILHEGAELDEATLLDWLRTRLARFKIPREVIFVDSLPRLGSNKFDRVTIQRLALHDAPAGANGN